MVAEWVTRVFLAVAAVCVARVSLALAAVASGLSRPCRALSANAERAPRRSALVLNGSAFAAVEDKFGAEEFELVFRSIDELVFVIEKSAVSIREATSNRDLADFAFIQIASFPSPTGTILNAIAAYLRHHGVDAVNAEGIGAPSRLLQYVRLAQAGIPVPTARYLPPRLLVDAYPDLAEQLGLPFVLSVIKGGTGKRDILIRDERSFAERMKAVGSAYFLAREFIPADVTYRLLILGDEAPIVMRQGFSFSESDQTKESGHVSLISSTTFSLSARILGVQAASLMGLEVAEVRVVRHWATGEWYVLDTRSTPQFSAGPFAPEKLNAYSAYLRRKLGSHQVQGSATRRRSSPRRVRLSTALRDRPSRRESW